MMLNPVDRRTCELSKMKLPSSLTAFRASSLGSHSEPASTNTAPCMPRFSGRKGKGKRSSAVLAQKSLPPRESRAAVAYPVAVEGVFASIAGTVARALEAAHRLTALEEQVGHADILAAPTLDVAALHAADQGDLVGDGIVAAPIGDRPDVVHVAADAREVLRERGEDAGCRRLRQVAGVVSDRVADARDVERRLRLASPPARRCCSRHRFLRCSNL